MKFEDRGWSLHTSWGQWLRQYHERRAREDAHKAAQAAAKEKKA